MTTLITGGTGKTGLLLAKLLRQQGHAVLITSRTGKAPEPFNAVQFDWLDPSTFTNPFDFDSDIKKLYIVAPNHIYNPLPHMKPFIDLAVSKGVKRFVLLTGTQSNPGKLPLGAIHQYLVDLGVDYAVIRPTWFIENFSTLFYKSIRERGEISSSAGDGRIPFVSAEDIAQAALDALTAKKSPNRDYFLVGPELYSYDEAAKLLSSVLDREIVHKRNTPDDQFQLFGGSMMPDYARHLVGLEELAKNGAEEKIFNESGNRNHVGKHTLLEHFEKNKELLRK